MPNRSVLVLGGCLVAITCLATRLTLMRLSLWEDEAWVANSVLAPSLSGMFHYPNWLQTSPPLFLLLVRFATVFGRNEVALRLLPWLAGTASVVLLAMALIRLFPPALAVLGTVFFVANYWSIKYSQQVKQFTMDLLVATAFLFLLLLFLQNGPTRKIFWGLVLVGAIGIFLSYPAIFWFPVVFIAIAISPHRGGLDLQRGNVDQRWMRRWILPCLIASAAYLGSLGMLDLFFIRANRPPNLLQFWGDDFIGSGGFASSLLRFLGTVCNLMVPQQFSRLLSFALGAVLMVALVRAAWAALGADGRAQNLLLVTNLPVCIALLLSAFRQYPLLSYPRMLIWMLPLCTVLLVYAAEPLWGLLTSKLGASHSNALVAGATVLVCAFAVCFSLFIAPRSNGQDARSAILFLKDHAGPQDPIFVRGITTEQLTYYSDFLHWHSPSLYVGNTNLPCCLRSFQVFASGLADAGFADDIRSFARTAAGRRAWFLLERGAYRKMQETIGNSMSYFGCRASDSANFEGISLLRFDCTYSSQAK